MPNPSKGLTSRITLRTSAIEQTIVQRTRAYMAEAGVKLSANDTILFLIQTAAVPVPLNPRDAWEAVTDHTSSCATCRPDAPPACALGVHVRDAFVRVSHAFPAPPAPPPARAEIPAGSFSAATAAAASAAAASVAGRVSR